jgi:hypothetical protein
LGLGVTGFQGQHSLQQRLALLGILGQPSQLQPGLGAAWVSLNGRAQQAAGLFHISLAGCQPARFKPHLVLVFWILCIPKAL